MILFLPLRDCMLGLKNGELLDQRCWKSFLKTSGVASVLGLKWDKRHDDNIWMIADGLQPAALLAWWTVLSEQVETGGLFASVVDTSYTVSLRLVVVVCSWGLESCLSPWDAAQISTGNKSNNFCWWLQCETNLWADFWEGSGPCTPVDRVIGVMLDLSLWDSKED